MEINEKFTEQKERVENMLFANDFLFESKNKSVDNPKSKNLYIYNYIFKKK